MIRSMVFDLDGTLVQTEKLKALSYARAAVQLDPGLQESDVIEAFRVVVGRSRREVAEYLLEEFDLATEARSLMARYQVATPWQAYVQVRLGLYEDMLSDDETILGNQWPHNMALLQHARASCGKIGLATMSHCRQVRRVLSVLGIEDVFDFVASRDDVENGKPDPEIYLLMAAALETPASECLAIEDSPAGVASALSAGMHVIAITTPFTRRSLRAANLLPDHRVVDEPERVHRTVESLLHEQRNK